MDWGFVIGLGVIALVLIGLLVFFGRRLSKHVQKQVPESDFAVSITPTGNLLFGGMAGFWGVCLIAWKLAPSSGLGAFVSTIDGAVTAWGGSVLVFTVVMVVLEKLGYPSIERGDRGT